MLDLLTRKRCSVGFTYECWIYSRERGGVLDLLTRVGFTNEKELECWIYLRVLDLLTKERWSVGLRRRRRAWGGGGGVGGGVGHKYSNSNLSLRPVGR